MHRRLTISLFALLLLVFLAGIATVGAWSPDKETALALVELPDEAAVLRLEQKEWPVYKRITTTSGDFAIVGLPYFISPTYVRSDLQFEILDETIAEGGYYLVSQPVGRDAVQWSEYGQVLLDAGNQSIVRMTAQRAEQAASAGAFLALITLEPKQFEPVQPRVSIPASATYDPLIHTMMEQVDGETARQYLGDLSGEWPVDIGGEMETIASRHTANTASLDQAIRYVSEHFEALGLDVTDQRWTQGDYSSENVIAEIAGQGRPNDIFMISAHLDDMPGGDVAPGADDNGSGSVGVLIAADILSQYDWDCTLRFALWTGEEQGLLGSSAYAQAAKAADEDILGVINLDMISWNAPHSEPIIEAHYHSDLPQTENLAHLFADVISTYRLGLTPVVLGSNIPYSDHAAFWDHGYTAMLGIEDSWYGDTTDFNPYYHTTDDLVDHVDQAYFVDMIKAAVGTTAHMGGCLIPGDTSLLHGTVSAVLGGVPLPDATVTMTATTGHVYHASTAATGVFSRTLPSGLYDISVDAEGYLPGVVTGVSLDADALVTQDFALVNTDVPTFGYRVVNTYPHDPAAFTQGLVYEESDYLYEGTGMYQNSDLRKVELESGKVVQRRALNDEAGENYFGEGVTTWEDRIIQLTWQHNTGFIYDKVSFAELGQFSYPTQGWGLTHDGEHLIMSDGTATLHFLDPDTFAEVRSIVVSAVAGPVVNLNELEYINGEIFANVWYTDRIARIDPASGRVVGWIDLAGLLTPVEAQAANVLNGIAYDVTKDRLFVTGKYWPKLFEVELLLAGEEIQLYLPMIMVSK